MAQSGISALLVSKDPEAVETVERGLREIRDHPIDIVEVRSLRGAPVGDADLVVVDLRDFENKEAGIDFLRRTLSGEGHAVVVALVTRGKGEVVDPIFLQALTDAPESEIVLWPPQGPEFKESLRNAMAAAGLVQTLRRAITGFTGINERLKQRLDKEPA